MYFDGLLMKKGTGAGLVFVSPLRVRMRYMVRIHFPSSNNVAKYEALINGPVHRHRVGYPMPRRPGRLLASQRPSHEEVELP